MADMDVDVIEAEVTIADDIIPDSSSDKVEASIHGEQSSQRISPKASPSLTPVGSTPGRDPTPISTRPIGVYNDSVPEDALFWVEINPKPTFDGDLCVFNEEEFNVAAVYEEFGEGDDLSYDVQFEDDHIAKVSLNKLLCYPNGDVALQAFRQLTKAKKRLRKPDTITSYFDLSESDLSDDDLTRSDPAFDVRRSKRQRALTSLSRKAESKSRQRKVTRSRASKRLVSLGDGYREDESDISFSESEKRIGTRRSSREHKSRSSLRYEVQSDFSEDDESEEQPSGRTSRSSVKPRVQKSTEYFPVPDEDSDFAQRHQYWCQFSNDYTAIKDDRRDYTMCQGCSFMYHVECLSTKASRLQSGQNVIVVDERNKVQTCVLQCGRCSGGGKTGHITMRCLACGEIGDRCGEFKHPEKAEISNEETVEDDVDAIAERNDKLLQGWNDASKVMFRCMRCHRACHFDHLPPVIGQDEQHNQTKPDIELSEEQHDTDGAVEMQIDQVDDAPKDPDAPSNLTGNLSNGIETELAVVSSEDHAVPKPDTLEAYTDSNYWRCNECRQYVDKKVEVVLGWRSSTVSMPEDAPDEFSREYLIKFEEESYARALWVLGTWLSGVSYAMKSNFDAKKMAEIESSEDVIPEAWLRADIIFDVLYEDDRSREAMRFKSETAELDALPKVTEALCKWQKLKYEETTWEIPPTENDQRIADFKAAYEEYVRGNWVHIPNHRGKKSPYADLSKDEDVIQAEFGHRLEKKEQPEWIEGGNMFDYQLEGMNWLYFQWYKQTSAILADEMGLGKTIQIIAMISTIFKEHKRWPFLVIAPNSTIENWRREFKKWAPSLKVVAWPGNSEGRELVQQYELCHPKAPNDLKAHVVISGYGTARTTVSFLRKFQWECLIVDEGQALKNDKSDLFRELCTLHVQHRIILTGTPLQNNIRELFNIMQFLDPSQFDAEELEGRYEELDEEGVREIHGMLRPRFLRRTKADALTSLPPESEIIIPLSMSSVQKELYKSIVSQNSELMKAITTRAEKGQNPPKSAGVKLQNILMQLRKCLAHPFVQSPDLEDHTADPEQEKRALIEASGKLSFLAKILPKLKERGHRVLIFSQFLDMLDLLEDFLSSIGFRFGRLDGSTVTGDRQHMIDEFNAPDSQMDCFLLSTRAGGAGINLATADTVIVYDPDHNPHQDMQAVARAHRIGQKNKVLVFRLMMRNTVEERIYQTSKKKMVLDHLIVESLDNNEERLEVEKLLLHGLKALFEDTGEKDIKYDDADIDNLLDRSQIEQTVAQDTSDEGVLGSFKTARIWANSTAKLEDLPDEETNILEVGYWDRIIQERMLLAQAQRQAQQEEIGRGKRRASRKVNYVPSSPNFLHTSDLEPEPETDDEFEAPQDAVDESDDEPDQYDVVADSSLLEHAPRRQSHSQLQHFTPGQLYALGQQTAKDLSSTSANIPHPLSTFPYSVPGVPASLQASLQGPSFRSKPLTVQGDRGLSLLPIPPNPIRVSIGPSGYTNEVECRLCRKLHKPGECSLRQVEIEQCPACGYHHFHVRRTCPLLQDADYIEAMYERLKESTEDPQVIKAAKQYLTGVRADLALRKRIAGHEGPTETETSS